MVQADKRQQQEYQKLVDEKKPKAPVFKHVLLAFIIGGLICVVGQLVLEYFISHGLSHKDAVAPTLAVMILLGAVATGFGVYDILGEIGGAGAAVPITGFANTIVSAAMDFKREGLILGMAAKMFVIAGPVLVFGIITGFLMGVIAALIK